ncbi:ABC transporter ATP-binding protein [Proteobacteria bacterium 005FR1]|nr:ABC transporter ATP-binding protein [Proteobacteria bacterium 005FR1]
MSLMLKGVAKSVGGASHIYPTDLEVGSGLTVLLGHTLAGKTTLMRIIAGLDTPSSGRVYHNDRDVTDLPLRRRKVAMVYQQFINYPSFTVYDNIASPLKLAKLDKAEADRRVRETAELLRIDNYLQRLPSELSGGQQQRVAIARALVKEADLLLFDEPLVNLDYKLREELRQEMTRIFSERKAIAIYATTEPGEALLLGGTTVVMDRGRVLQSGPSLEVYRRPVNVRTAEVFSDPRINTASAAIADGRVQLGATAFSLPAGMAPLAAGEYIVALRAGHLRLERRDPEDVCLAARVELSEVSGSETFIHVRHGNVRWIVHQPGVHSYRSDDEVKVFFSPDQLFAFDSNGELRHTPFAAAA